MKHETHEAPHHEDGAGKHKSTVLFFLGLIVFLFLAQTGYVFWQKSNLEKSVADLQSRIALKEEKVKEYTNGQTIENHASALEALQASLADRVDWSSANREIQRLGKEMQTEITFLDYSSTTEQKFSIRGAARSVESLAKMLETFEASDQIENAFLVNFQEQQNVQYAFAGRKPRTVYLFSLSFDYLTP